MPRFTDALNAGLVFAPFTLRLSMRLEQVRWAEVAESAGEAVFLIRSGQRLFGLDAVCASFDTWLEAEAAGLQIERDDLGEVSDAAILPHSLPPVASLLSSEAIARTVDVVRRLAQEQGATLTFAPITAPATFLARVGQAAGATLDYAQSLSVGLAKAYFEAGADAIVLLQEVDSPDVLDIAALGALFNVASYYARPVIVVCRHSPSVEGMSTLDRLTNGLWISASENGARVGVVSGDAQMAQRSQLGQLLLSRWEVPAQTDPDVVRSWRNEAHV